MRMSEQKLTNQEGSVDGREQRGLRTRHALLEAALRLLDGDQSFDGLSLREVTREAGIVPTAFYRHFRDMQELGLALVDESMATLRQMIRSARTQGLPAEHIIRASVEILVRHVRDHRLHFRFIARERHGGVAALRQAIRREIASFTNELALDLGRFPVLDKWRSEDLQMLAGLMVNAMTLIAESILDAPLQRPQAEEEIIRNAEKQLRLIMLGVPLWKSR